MPTPPPPPPHKTKHYEVGKDHPVNNFVNEAIKLMHIVYYKQKSHTYFCMVGGVLLYDCYQVLMEAVADPTWGPSRHGTV